MMMMLLQKDAKHEEMNAMLCVCLCLDGARDSKFVEGQEKEGVAR